MKEWTYLKILLIYIANGLYPQSIDSYINTVDECYSVYWLEDDSKFEMNIIDKSNMEKYLDVTIKELQKSNNFKRFQPQYIKVAAQLCVLKRLDEAFFFYHLFDKRELKNWNLHTRIYFQFVTMSATSTAKDCFTNLTTKPLFNTKSNNGFDNWWFLLSTFS